MKPDVSRIVGICGLYCGTCPLYLAHQKNDVEQLEKHSKRFNIPVEEVRCDGCHSGRLSPNCVNCPPGFRQCARDNKVRWCFQCHNFPCQRLRDFRDAHIIDGISHHAWVIEDLQYMKEYGIEQWVEEQERAGQCPQCGERLYWFVRECPDCHTQVRVKSA
ncbi:DUF3795 domain-containing protein [Chloroflexota bacterium]